ncbi:hypothetical protein LCGC14_2806090, partial [marine sediment metagenome]
HTFGLRKHINKIRTFKTIESLKNYFYVWSGVGSAHPNYVDQAYTDATSVTAYDVVADLKIDSGIHTDAHADLEGTKEIAENKDPKTRVAIELNNKYDLSSIEPGQTCKIVDIKTTGSPFPTDMLIVKVKHTPEVTLVELAEFGADLARMDQTKLAELEKNIAEIENGGVLLALTAINTDFNLITDIINFI